MFAYQHKIHSICFVLKKRKHIEIYTAHIKIQFKTKKIYFTYNKKSIFNSIFELNCMYNTQRFQQQQQQSSICCEKFVRRKNDWKYSLSRSRIDQQYYLDFLLSLEKKTKSKYRIVRSLYLCVFHFIFNIYCFLSVVRITQKLYITHSLTNKVFFFFFCSFVKTRALWMG